MRPGSLRAVCNRGGRRSSSSVTAYRWPSPIRSSSTASVSTACSIRVIRSASSGDDTALTRYSSYRCFSHFAHAKAAAQAIKAPPPNTERASIESVLMTDTHSVRGYERVRSRPDSRFAIAARSRSFDARPPSSCSSSRRRFLTSREQKLFELPIAPSVHESRGLRASDSELNHRDLHPTALA